MAWAALGRWPYVAGRYCGVTSRITTSSVYSKGRVDQRNSPGSLVGALVRLTSTIAGTGCGGEMQSNLLPEGRMRKGRGAPFVCTQFYVPDEAMWKVSRHANAL